VMTTSYIMRAYLLALLLSVSFALVHSQTNETQVQTAPLTSSPSVHTSYVFPDYPSQKLPSGELIEVLVGFTNNGQKTVKITNIGASLNHPQDFRYYIQNYTKFEYDVLVHPDEQVSLAYRFRPDALLEPREFGLIVSVYYHDEGGGNFTTAFFNGTIDIVDPDNGFDFQQAFIYLGLVAIVGLGGFFGYQSLGKKTRLGRRRITPTPYVEVGTVNKKTPTVTLDNEWLEGTHAVSPARERTQPKKKEEKKKQK